MTEFAVETRVEGRRAVVALRGELDLTTAGEVERRVAELRGNGIDELVLDLRELAFLDSSGLRCILLVRRDAQAAGRRFAVVRGPEAVQRVLQVVNLERELELVDDPAELG